MYRIYYEILEIDFNDVEEIKTRKFNSREFATKEFEELKNDFIKNRDCYGDKIFLYRVQETVIGIEYLEDIEISKTYKKLDVLK